MRRSERLGEPVRALQTMLRVISQSDNGIPTLIPNGVYGPETMAAVTAFQRRNALPITGVTDLVTWNAVVAAYRAALIEVGPAAPVYPVWQPGQVIRPGETNDHLYMIHGMLQAVGARFPSMPSCGGGNVHDEASVAAVQWLQSRSALAATGALDRMTWRFLARLYRLLVGDGADSS